MSYAGAPQRQIGHQKIITPGVRAVIRDSEGPVLLQRRGDFGTWGLPARGLELDETVSDALAREAHEETGLIVGRVGPFGIYSDPAYSIPYPNGDQTAPFTIAFLVEEWSDTPVGDGDETLELGFFALDALPPEEAIHPSHRNALRDVLAFLANRTLLVD